MYDHQLDTFLLVAKTGSFSAAAEESYISPSAISQQITLLERKLGTRLFIRSKKGIALTEAGQRLAAEAPKLIALSQRIIDQVRGVDQPLRLGWSTGLEDETFIKVCLSLRDMGVTLTPFPSGGVLAALEEQSIDLCVFMESPRYAKMGYKFLPLSTARQVIVMPPNDAFGDRESITLKELGDTRLYLLKSGELADHDALSQKVQREGWPIRLCALPNYGFTTRARIFEESAVFLGIDRFAWQYAPLRVIPLRDGIPIRIGLVMRDGDDPRLHRIARALKAAYTQEG